MNHVITVYSWGRGDFGQLGLGDESDRSFPSLVQSLADKDILHVAAGDFHTAFLTGLLPYIAVVFFSSQYDQQTNKLTSGNHNLHIQPLTLLGDFLRDHLKK